MGAWSNVLTPLLLSMQGESTLPLKLSVGLSRKQGLPRYGSAGATCHVEVELPSDALKATPSFLAEAERALDACRQVVETELARQSMPRTEPDDANCADPSCSASCSTPPKTLESTASAR